MPKTNYRLVVLSKDYAQVFDGNTCVAEFEIENYENVTAEEVEYTRIANYPERKA